MGGLAGASGTATRSGWLFRSDTLARLSPGEGVRAVRAAGVTTVVDLRDEPLRRRQPVPLDGGYVRALEAAVKLVAPIVREIAGAPGGVVFHCHSGTGRTGVLAA